MYDCIIIGAGPAGLMAAIEASKNNKVLLIERNSKPGRKLLLTGGGRCNLTNLKTANEFLEVVEYNKKYLYSSINRFGPQDVYNYFIENGVPLKEERNNEIFPVSNKADDILQALLKNTSEVEFKYNESVIEIHNGDIKEVLTESGTYLTKNVIIATGGASYKETGSEAHHMSFARQLRQPTKDLFPAETSIILKDNPDLAGTSIDEVEVKYLKRKTTGNLMFTHKGLSGTSIMKMSEHIYLNDNKNIVIDLIPNIDALELDNLIISFDQEKEVAKFLNTLFTKRFSNHIVTKLNLHKKIKALGKNEILNLINFIKAMPFEVDRVEDLDKAYVTGGGIDLNHINTTTMESKINKGIYFVGEALDIHGPIGGYNITLALSTGYVAGSAIGKSHPNKKYSNDIFSC